MARCTRYTMGIRRADHGVDIDNEYHYCSHIECFMTLKLEGGGRSDEFSGLSDAWRTNDVCPPSVICAVNIGHY